MDIGKPITRYQVYATIIEGVVEWTFAIETEGGERHNLQLRDGEEVPLLLDLCRNDRTMYFDKSSNVLRTGWNLPGRTPVES
jgi:hypothetical protein